MQEGEAVRRLRREVQQCLASAERAMRGGQQQPSYTNGHAAAMNGGGETRHWLCCVYVNALQHELPLQAM